MKTSKRALKALRRAIDYHWHDIIEGGYDWGSESFPLCELYRKENCRSCPIRIETGKTICRNTPYWDWVDYQNDNKRDKYGLYQIFDKESKRLAIVYSDWLEALYKKLVRRNKRKARGE